MRHRQHRGRRNHFDMIVSQNGFAQGCDQFGVFHQITQCFRLDFQPVKTDTTGILTVPDGHALHRLGIGCQMFPGTEAFEDTLITQHNRRYAAVLAKRFKQRRIAALNHHDVQAGIFQGTGEGQSDHATADDNDIHR